MLRGNVATFQTDRGVGVIETSTGERLAFHCTAVSDGSRRIDEGAAVILTVGPGRHGRWEAVEVARV
jgi:cold shock CspA family protein